jgi:uncharacterized radical SAM superfamily Fe-S cluster-containing enzyme
MAEQLCPACGCHIDADAYEKDGVIYCCKPCATGGQCECGCCEVTEPPAQEG